MSGGTPSVQDSQRGDPPPHRRWVEEGIDLCEAVEALDRLEGSYAVAILSPEAGQDPLRSEGKPAPGRRRRKAVYCASDIPPSSVDQ